MAVISKIFCMRRALKSTMQNSKANTVLASGENFLEIQGSTVGKSKVKMKMGDGSTAYKDLPYVLGDTSTDPISFQENAATDATTALGSVTTGQSLDNIVSGLKKAVSLNTQSLTELNDDENNLEKKLPFALGKDSSGNYGYYKDGADTVTPFKSQADVDASYKTGYNQGVTDGRVGYYTKEQYDANYTSGYNAGKAAAYTASSSRKWDTIYTLNISGRAADGSCNIVRESDKAVIFSDTLNAAGRGHNSTTYTVEIPGNMSDLVKIENTFNDNATIWPQSVGNAVYISQLSNYEKIYQITGTPVTATIYFSMSYINIDWWYSKEIEIFH